MNPTVQNFSHWFFVGLPCSVNFSTFHLLLIRWFDENTAIKLGFIQLRLHPFLQLFFQMCENTSVICCLIVLTLLCFRYQLQSIRPKNVQFSRGSTEHSVVHICFSSATCVALQNFWSIPPLFNSIKAQTPNISFLLALTHPSKLLAIAVTLSHAIEFKLAAKLFSLLASLTSSSSKSKNLYPKYLQTNSPTVHRSAPQTLVTVHNHFP